MIAHALHPVETQSCDFRRGSGLAQGGNWGIRNPGQKFLFKITSFATNFPGEPRGSVFSRMGSIRLRAHGGTQPASLKEGHGGRRAAVTVTEE